MKKIIFVFLLFALLPVGKISGQVTIGSATEPDESALLELKSEQQNKGFLGPRIELVKKSQKEPVPNPATGLLVFNIKDSPAGVEEEERVFANRFYYWDGESWVEFISHNSLDMILENELDALGIPRVAIFTLDGQDNISPDAGDGIVNFMQGVKPGEDIYLPLKESVNHTNNAVSMVRDTIDYTGEAYERIYFTPGIYTIVFSYQIVPYGNSPRLCFCSSYFMDFPLELELIYNQRDRVRIHSNSFHGTGDNSQHGGSVRYVVKFDHMAYWDVKLGVGSAGNCTNSGGGIAGFAMENSGTYLYIMKM